MKNNFKSEGTIMCFLLLTRNCQTSSAAQILNIGKEMVRINSAKNRIEYSTDKGRNWSKRN